MVGGGRDGQSLMSVFSVSPTKTEWLSRATVCRLKSKTIGLLRAIEHSSFYDGDQPILSTNWLLAICDIEISAIQRAIDKGKALPRSPSARPSGVIDTSLCTMGHHTCNTGGCWLCYLGHLQKIVALTSTLRISCRIGSIRTSEIGTLCVGIMLVRHANVGATDNAGHRAFARPWLGQHDPRSRIAVCTQAHDDS